MWMRQPISLNARNQFDAPLTWSLDETDVLVFCDKVKVPWEKVFVMDDVILAREIYIRTPGHCYGNHQSNVRFWSKMELIVGLCSKVTQATGANEVPSVRETLGRMAALEATLSGIIHGQIEAAEEFTQLVEINPGYQAAYYHGGQTYLKLGRKDEAQEWFRKGIDLAGRTGDSHARDELLAALQESS